MSIGIPAWEYGISGVFKGISGSKQIHLSLTSSSSLYGYANGPNSAIVNKAKGHVQEAAVKLVDEDEEGSEEE